MLAIHSLKTEPSTLIGRGDYSSRLENEPNGLTRTKAEQTIAVANSPPVNEQQLPFRLKDCSSRMKLSYASKEHNIHRDPSGMLR